jgi:hypothetical protein
MGKAMAVLRRATTLVEHLPLLQQIQLPTFRLLLFSGERLVVGAGKDLAYKRSSDNWKVWARS